MRKHFQVCNTHIVKEYTENILLHYFTKQIKISFLPKKPMWSQVCNVGKGLQLLVVYTLS
jgi:hypothetical protein